MNRKQTPWGLSDSAGETVAEGIVFYSTPSHGGYHLSPERMAEFRNVFPKFTTYAGGPWFEEDCDHNAVALAFPQFFRTDQVVDAVRFAKDAAVRGYGESWQHVMDVLHGNPLDLAKCIEAVRCASIASAGAGGSNA